MKKQLYGFKSAFKGIWSALKSEGHMRFHMVAAFYVIIFSFFYSFSPVQWSVLVLTISLVMVLEMVNTCLERLSDFSADRYEPVIKLAKDISAGAVLIAAVAASVVAVIFFLDFRVIAEIFAFLAQNPICILLLVVSAMGSVVFVWLGPVGIKTKITRIRRKAKSNSK